MPICQSVRPGFTVKAFLRDSLDRIRSSYRMEGHAGLLHRTLQYVKDLLFWNRCMFLYERVFPVPCPISDASVPLAAPDGFRLRVILSKKDADELEAEGFVFRAALGHAQNRLEAGAIAFCAFHGAELASSGWVALTQEAQVSLPEPHVQVDFSRNESFTGGTLTNPRFRGMGLMTYILAERCRFLKEMGIRKDRSTALKANIASRHAAARTGYRIAGEVGFKNRPAGRIWREWPLPRQPGSGTGRKPYV